METGKLQNSSPDFPLEAYKRSNWESVSKIYSKMRVTQVSWMVLPEMGFIFPWNVPIAPYEKKVVLTFLMASLTALVAERSHDHQYSRDILRTLLGIISAYACAGAHEGRNAKMQTFQMPCSQH